MHHRSPRITTLTLFTSLALLPLSGSLEAQVAQRAPAGQDAEPVGQDAEPVGQDAEPVGQDAEPVGQDAEPVGQDAEPVGQDAEPVGQDAEPVGQDAEPVGQDAQPVGQDAKPTGHEAAPAGVDAVPAGQDAEPVGQEAVPAGVDAKPAGVDAAPAGQHAVPAGQDAVPLNPDPKIRSKPPANDDSEQAQPAELPTPAQEKIIELKREIQTRQQTIEDLNAAVLMERAKLEDDPDYDTGFLQETLEDQDYQRQEIEKARKQIEKIRDASAQDGG